ncbi:hypothetical protein VCHA29O37_210036 [Vibrio chagasii]|nr:hypothetical protein VCHA29O37_210036 [Vibrio chagasii]
MTGKAKRSEFLKNLKKKLKAFKLNKKMKSQNQKTQLKSCVFFDYLFYVYLLQQNFIP